MVKCYRIGYPLVLTTNMSDQSGLSTSVNSPLKMTEMQESLGMDGTNCVDTVTSGPSSMRLNNMKAGMNSVDVDKVNQIIYEASKNSKYFLHQQKRQQEIAKRIENLTRRREALAEHQISESVKEMDRLAKILEKERNLSRTIVHIDMDAFYAAVEIRDAPSLAEKPVAVGGLSMLDTSNYHARKFGVRAAMPGFIAKKLCPELIIVPPNFEKYREVSLQVRTILANYDPQFSAMSLDEAYLDLTEYVQKMQISSDEEVTAGEVVDEIRRKIYEVTQLTASAGIAPNTRLAKICSDQNKPNGQFELPPDIATIMKFIRQLPIRKVNGIGNVTEQLLNGLGIKTCGDLWEQRGILALLFSNTSSNTFLRICLGIGSTKVYSDETQKSISVERTFPELKDPDELLGRCKELSFALSEDMKERGLVGKTVTLKIKTVYFEIKTKAKSLPSPTVDPRIIFSAAKSLLEDEIAAAAPKPLRLRLMGVRMSSLSDQMKCHGKQSIIEDFLCLQSRQDNKLGVSFISDEFGETSVYQDDECDDVYISGSDLDFRPEDKYHVDISWESNATSILTADNCFQLTVPSPEGLQLKKVDDETDLMANCPICNLALKQKDLKSFNAHIDLCLNKKAIHELLSCERSMHQNPVPLSKKRGLISKVKKLKKKRKCNSTVTLDCYFKS